MRRFKNCICVKDTGKAILVENEDGESAWVPQSQVDEDSEVYSDGDEGTLVVSKWFSDRIEWN